MMYSKLYKSLCFRFALVLPMSTVWLYFLSIYNLAIGLLYHDFSICLHQFISSDIALLFFVPSPHHITQYPGLYEVNQDGCQVGESGDFPIGGCNFGSLDLLTPPI